MHTDLSQDKLHAFMRAFFHVKSAQYPSRGAAGSHNGIKADFEHPNPLRNFSLEEIERIPPYFIMPRGMDMPKNIWQFMPTGEDLARSQQWLPDGYLAVYAAGYGRTGFQGGLNRYQIVQGLGREEDVGGSVSVADEEFMSQLTVCEGKD